MEQLNYVVIALEPHPDIVELWKGVRPHYLFGNSGDRETRPSIFDPNFAEETAKRVKTSVNEYLDIDICFLLLGATPGVMTLLLVLGEMLASYSGFRFLTFDKKSQTLKDIYR